jgi:hypothetical protein
MRKITLALFSFIFITGLFTACGSTITQQDLTNARQTSYQVGYNQGLTEGNSSSYNKGYSEGYTAAANAILAVWPPGYPPPVISPPVFSAQ